MRALAQILCLVSAAYAADDLALLSRAVADYERVELSARPDLKDAIACVQSQAALLPATRPEEQYLVHFRKGVCELTAARLRNSRNEYRDAVADFQQAIAKWPATTAGDAPVTSALRVALAISRAHTAGEPSWRELAEDLRPVVNRPNCPGTLLMSASNCEAYARTGRLWLGWALFQQGRFEESVRVLAPWSGSPWVALVKGRQALAGGDYQEAAGWLAMALEPAPRTGVQGLLAPEIDQRDARYYRARALYGTGRYSEVSDVLEPVLKGPARDPDALFLRARAREMQGLSKGALADYELASRAAFADVGTQFTSGNAHFYRGIALFRRGDFERAENAFASALNFQASPEIRPDVQAWRHMAAVAGGACDTSASLLQAAIPGTSNLFPKTEADMLLRACQAREVSRVN